MREPRTQRNTTLKWLGPLLWASVIVGLIVGVLVTVRQRRAPPPASGPPAAEGTARQADESAAPPDARTPRHMLPADAWAVLDVDLARLTEADANVPQLFKGVDCNQVDPPRRIAVSLLAPTGLAPEDHFEFLVATTETSERFRACARSKMLEGNASSEAWPGGFEVLTREGGLRLIVREQTQEALFANAPAHETAHLLEVLAGTGPNAAEQGHHAVLLSSLETSPGPLLTIALPRDWMHGLVTPEEASLSPLRFLRAAAWTLDNRGLAGLVDCRATADGAGCKTLARFIEDSRLSLLDHLPERQRSLLHGEWTLEAERPTRLRLRWQLSPDARAQLLTALLRLAH